MQLWHRLVATAPVGPLAWEPPYAMGAALERQRQYIYKLSHIALLCKTEYRFGLGVAMLTFRLPKNIVNIVNGNFPHLSEIIANSNFIYLFIYLFLLFRDVPNGIWKFPG